MKQYTALLDTMMDSIMTGNAACAPTLLREKPEFSATEQLNVYIEGYRIRLHEALENAYPALIHYLEKPAFAKLAEGFISAHPSRTFNLDKYPNAFAGYAAAQCDDAFVGDLAVLEGAIHGVYQDEETPAIDAQWLKAQTPAVLVGLRLLPRAASRLLACATPVNDYLSLFREGKQPAKPAPQKSWLLVLRHKHQVRRLTLEEDEHMLLTLLGEGLALAVALEDARLAPYLARADFAAALQGWLARWVSEGVLRQPS